MLGFEIFAAAWFFVLGSVIGSFLNVVVWRTPCGESIIGSSRCPKCGTAIRWYNNVPIFGWFWLRGKCRDCKLPISPRYPTVEFISGAMFLAVALAELASGHARYAGSSHTQAGGFADVILDPDWPRLAAYALHMLLLCALLAWALMQVDEQYIPVNQIAGLWLVGFVAGAVLPADQTLLTAQRGSNSIPRAWQGLLQAITGFIFGGSIAAPIALFWRWRSARGQPAREPYWAIVVAIASVGLFLGVEAVVIVTMLVIVLRSLSLLAGLALPPLRKTPLTMDIFVAALAQICCVQYFSLSHLVTM